MARNRRMVPIFTVAIPEDTRPSGEMKFADPSTAAMTARFNTFNEPHSPGSTGHQTGIRTPFGSQAPWSQTHDGDTAWSDMQKKRGVDNGQEE